LFRLIEYYINTFQSDAIHQIYGKGSRIKIHSINFSITSKTILIESIVILGEIITEQHMDRELADILVQDALVYFFPEFPIKNHVRFDV